MCSMFSPRLKRHGFCCYPNFTKSLFFIFYKYCQISIVHYGNKISMFVFTHGKVLKCGHLPTLSLCLTIIISCGPLFWQCSHPQAFLPYTQFIKLLTPCRLLYVLFLFYIMDSTCGWIPIVIRNPQKELFKTSSIFLK